jgi:hypothetical protein
MSMNMSMKWNHELSKDESNVIVSAGRVHPILASAVVLQWQAGRPTRPDATPVCSA